MCGKLLGTFSFVLCWFSVTSGKYVRLGVSEELSRVIGHLTV